MNKAQRKGNAEKGNQTNQDQAQGKWEQLKGAAKQSWGKLTDDDFTKAEGSAEKLYGIIHEKFGDAKEAVRAKLEHGKEIVHAKVDELKDSAKAVPAKADELKDSTKELSEANVGRLEAQLAQWGAKLDELVVKANQAGAEVKADYHKRLEEIKVRYHAAQLKFEESKVAGSEKWETLKHGVESAWNDLEAAFKKITN